MTVFRVGPIGISAECTKPKPGFLAIGFMLATGHGQRWGIHPELGLIVRYIAVHLVWEGWKHA